MATMSRSTGQLLIVVALLAGAVQGYFLYRGDVRKAAQRKIDAAHENGEPAHTDAVAPPSPKSPAPKPRPQEQVGGQATTPPTGVDPATRKRVLDEAETQYRQGAFSAALTTVAPVVATAAGAMTQDGREFQQRAAALKRRIEEAKPKPRSIDLKAVIAAALSRKRTK